MKTESDVSVASRKYWVQVFSVETWNEFLDAGAAVTGFPRGRWRQIQRLNIGDWVLCYVSKVSLWVGVLEVKSAPYIDITPIWGKSLYPSRLQVRLLKSLPLVRATPIRSLADKLSIFETHNWGLRMLASPSLWKEDDAKVVIKALSAQREENRAE